MIFARVVFWVAGAFGLAALIPLYRAPGNPTYFGFLATLVAWQVAFFIIGWDPRRFRLLMIPAILEKVLWMATLLNFYAKGQLPRLQLVGNAATHGFLGILFIIAFVVVRSSKDVNAPSTNQPAASASN
ncbi:MAG: hypothetical protein KGL02_03665 [Acidobacteriota bacterium]|nr:hypothetical protein [Acidobacteriota bacterium]